MAVFLSSTSTFRRRRSATPPPLSISNPSSSSSIYTPCRLNNFVVGRINNIANNKVSSLMIVKCESSSSSSYKKLEIGSPIIMVEAPMMLKTAASVPCLRSNSSLVNAGDVGRIVSRKPKDVWAVRLTSGTYLIDGRYFKPLELDV